MTVKIEIPAIDNEDFKDKIVLIRQAITISKRNNDTATLAQEYTILANAHYHVGNYQQAQSYWKKGSQFIQSNTDPLLVAYSHYTIGLILQAKNKFRMAQQAFINGIKACQETAHPDLLAKLFYHLSATQLELHQYDKGKINLDKARNSSHTSPQLDELAAHYDILDTHYKQGKQKLQSALKSFKKVFDENDPNIIRVNASLDQLKSGDEPVLRHQIATGTLFYSFKEYIHIFIALYKQTVDMFGSIKATTKQPSTDQYLHDYQFFCFTKSCKSFQAFFALINKGTPEDAMILLYAIYRNYLTMAHLNKQPDQAFALFNTQTDSGLRDLSSYPEDKVIHTFLNTHLSAFAYSNFTTSEYYRSPDETYYQYTSKALLTQATQIGLYLQILIIKEIGKLINNDKWKNLVNKFIREATPLLTAGIESAYKDNKKLLTAMKKRLDRAN